MSGNIKTSDTDEDILIYFENENISEFEDLEESSIFIFYNSNLVMIFDSKMKTWIVPSGKKEKKETMVDCITREAFAKTGAILENVSLIGYYTVLEGVAAIKKGIYFGKVNRFEPRPEWSEVDLVKLFDELPLEVKDKKMYKMVLIISNQNISLILKKVINKQLKMLKPIMFEQVHLIKLCPRL